MRRDTLADVTGLPATLEEVVNGLDLVARQWPLPCYAVLRARREVDLVAHATICWQLRRDLVGEDVGKLTSRLVDRVARRLRRLPRLRSKALFTRSALFGCDDVSAESMELITCDTESPSVIKHTCSMSPALRSRRKFFQERPGRLVMDLASRGGLATSMTRVRFGAPSTYSTVQTDSVGADGGSTARRGFNRLCDRRDVFERLEPLLKTEVSLSLDEASPSSRRESSLLDRLEVVREPLLDRLISMREPLLDRLISMREPLLDRLISMREPLPDRLVGGREPLLDRLVGGRGPLLDRFLHIREPLLDRLVLQPREPRMLNRSPLARARVFFIFVTSQQQCACRAERAIARSAHNVRRGRPVHDCDMGPISWRDQEMREDFGHVEVLTPLDRPS
ncbi:hypothetical protein PF003_g11273 [Phytophthora fragariae]|nr:hypothetical protein PF003_g11273 [Phytophthora fragariae]